MNAISPAPVNSDFHKMHKLDKETESRALKMRRNVKYDNKTITCPGEEKWLLNGSNDRLKQEVCTLYSHLLLGNDCKLLSARLIVHIYFPKCCTLCPLRH